MANDNQCHVTKLTGLTLEDRIGTSKDTRARDSAANKSRTGRRATSVTLRSIAVIQLFRNNPILTTGRGEVGDMDLTMMLMTGSTLSDQDLGTPQWPRHMHP